MTRRFCLYLNVDSSRQCRKPVPAYRRFCDEHLAVRRKAQRAARVDTSAAERMRRLREARGERWNPMGQDIAAIQAERTELPETTIADDDFSPAVFRMGVARPVRRRLSTLVFSVDELRLLDQIDPNSPHADSASSQEDDAPTPEHDCIGDGRNCEPCGRGLTRPRGVSA